MPGETQNNIKPLSQINWKSRTVILGLASIVAGIAALVFPNVITPEMLGGASPVQLIQVGALGVFFKS